jgi:hypothetical protein
MSRAFEGQFWWFERVLFAGDMKTPQSPQPGYNSAFAGELPAGSLDVEGLQMLASSGIASAKSTPDRRLLQSRRTASREELNLSLWSRLSSFSPLIHFWACFGFDTTDAPFCSSKPLYIYYCWNPILFCLHCGLTKFGSIFSVFVLLYALLGHVGFVNRVICCRSLLPCLIV